MDLVLASVRRAARRVATVLVALYASTGIVATASICMPGPHRHHGVRAPECVMHHQDAAHHGASASHGTTPDAHGHHGRPTNAPETAMTCACGEELRALHPADAAVPPATEPWAPFMPIGDADAGIEPRLPPFELPSSSPPPRA